MRGMQALPSLFLHGLRLVPRRISSHEGANLTTAIAATVPVAAAVSPPAAASAAPFPPGTSTAAAATARAAHAATA